MKVQGIHFWGYKPIVNDRTTIRPIMSVDIDKYDKSYSNHDIANAAYRMVMSHSDALKDKHWSTQQLKQQAEVRGPKHQSLADLPPIPNSTYNTLARYKNGGGDAAPKPYQVRETKYNDYIKQQSSITFKEIAIIISVIVLVYLTWKYL